MRTGFNGTLASKAYGLTAAKVVTKELVGTEPNFNPDAPAEGPAVAKVPFTVPAGSALARVGTYGADYGAGTDLDVFVYDKTGALVGQSAGGSAQETVDLPAGDYDVYVVQFALPGNTDKQTMKLNTFIVPQSSAGNLTVTPASQPAVLGKQVTVTAAWKGLTAGKHYLGQLVYGDGTFTATTTFAVDA
jgi:hypothetical protein